MRRIKEAVCIFFLLFTRAIAYEEKMVIRYDEGPKDLIPAIVILLSAAATSASTTHLGVITLIVLKIILVVGTFGLVKLLSAQLVNVVDRI